MHAFEIPGARFSLPAGGPVALHRFVAVNATGAIQSTASTAVVGVSMNEVTEKELETNERIVEIADGIVIVEAAGAITAGDKVASDAAGKAVKSDTGIAVALTSATGAGQLVTVKL